MPPQRTRDRKPSPTPSASFFAPRPRREGLVPHNYNNIERNEIIPLNTLRPAVPPIILFPGANPTANPPANDPPPGSDEYQDSDDEDTIVVDVPEPEFANTGMTEDEKIDAIKKWALGREKIEKRKRDKSSHVYWYMHCELRPGVFYTETKDSPAPKVLQEYKWHCKRCLASSHLGQKYVVLESNRRGVTSGMDKHLKAHGITKNSHFARIHGYSDAIGGGDYTELDGWSGKPMPRARLTARESTRRWFVKTRQPFSTIETKEFQEMFLAHGNQCAYKNRVTLRNHIYDDFLVRRDKLRYDLNINCVSISFTLDMWTSPNRKPIFAIIGHWYTPDFEEREEVLEFIQVEGEHTGERLAEITIKLLEELKLKHKLFAITGDNASNNGTLCYHLFQRLREEYDDRPAPVRPRMRFHGKLSFIRCLAHVINLICKDVLSSLKAGSAIEAKKTLDSWEKTFKSADYVIPKDNSRSAIAKVRFLNLWILRSSQREEDWAKLPRASNRKPIYDVDTRWNSAYNMIVQYLELEAEYSDFCNSHSQVKCLLLTAEEIVSLTQLAHVLAPFKEITLRVSEAMPSIVRSLELYWDLDDLMEKVTTGSGIYLQLDQSIRVAFEQGKMKHVKYIRKLEKHTMLYAAHILDPRCRTSLIKDMMPDKADSILLAVQRYFKREWPQTGVAGTPVTAPPLSTALPETRPASLSVAHWKALQKQHEQNVTVSTAPLQAELERWFQLTPVDWGNNDSPDFVRVWWKEHAFQWPRLAAAARDLLPCSASEVDVERLFSGCRDEYGIRRHSLKSETVRVLTLLRSAYKSEDTVDTALIKAAMELDIQAPKNSILWRPDNVAGQLTEDTIMSDPLRSSTTTIPPIPLPPPLQIQHRLQ